MQNPGLLRLVMVYGIIYSITHTVTGKMYIGQTRSHLSSGKKYGVICRWNSHVKDALSGKGECRKLHTALQKHGRESFAFEEMLRCNLEDSDDYERKFISMYDTVKTGYNICLGGKIAFTEEKKREIYKKVTIANVREWSDPEKRKKRQNSMKKSGHIGSKIMIECWADPEWRAQAEKRSRAKWTDAVREKASKSQNKEHPDLPSGILVYRHNQTRKITGYTGDVSIGGTKYRKRFTSMKNTPEQNLNAALLWLTELKVNMD